MRPLTRNTKPDYKIPGTIQIRTKKITTLLTNKKIYPISGTATYSMPQLLSFLAAATEYNNGKADWGNLDKDSVALVRLLIPLFSSSDTVGYGNARGPLIQNFGQLCDYCEMPVQDSSLAVEHILPKSQFPDVMLNYDNFFLACPVCNSIKGSKPTYLTCQGWAIKQQGISKPNYQQIKNGGFDYATWPTATDAYTGFSLDLYTANDTLISRVNSINTANTFAGTQNNQVWANISGAGKIAVKSKFTSSGSNVVKLQRDNIISLVNLNTTTAGTFADRRVTNRTVAWLQAIAAGNRLNIMFQADQTDDKRFYKFMAQQVLETVQSAGYLSTWAFIFYTLAPPLNNPLSYYTLLRDNVTDPGIPQFYIPGTNIAGLPAK